MVFMGICGALAVVLLLIYAGLASYEVRHRRPCALCTGTGFSEDGIRCPFCAGR